MNKAKPSQRRRSSMVPKAVQGEIQRERLLTQIANTRDAKLVMLMAPAGYGKTTLLAQACRASKRGTAWLTLSEDEASASRLASSLAAVISKSLPEVQLEIFTLAVSNGSAAEGLATALAADLNAVSINLDIVLDRAEHLGADATRWLERLLRELAEGHRVLLAGYDTTLPLAQWVAAGQVVLIETSELAFTAEETGAYLAARGSTASGSDAYESLEGWPAGVALIAAGATPRLQPRDLVLEVLQHLAADLRAVIAEAAVLEVWNEATARKLGCELPAGWLKITQRAGLPMTPMGRGSFRPHTVLLEVLETELLERPERYAILHEMAGKIAEKEGDHLRALKHIHCTGDLERALILALQLASAAIDRWEYRLARRVLETFAYSSLPYAAKVLLCQTLVETGDAAKGELLLNALLDEDDSDPTVLFLLGMLEYRRGQPQEVLKLAQKALQCSPDSKTKVLLLISISAAMQQLGRIQEDLDASLEALAVAEKDGRKTLLIRALDSLASSYGESQHREKCEQAFRRGIEMSERSGMPLRTVQSLNNFSSYLADWGRLEESLALCERGVAIAHQEGGVWLPLLLSSRGLQHMRLGQFALAQVDLEKAIALSEPVGLGGYAFGMRLWLTQSLFYQGKKDEAVQVAQEARVNTPDATEFHRARLAFVDGFLALAAGDLEKARSCLEMSLQGGVDSWDVPRVHAFQAEIARRQGRLTRTMIAALVESLNAAGHDRTLAMDTGLLSGLFTECIRRRWFSERFSEVATHSTHETGLSKLEVRTLGTLEVRLQHEVVHIPLAKSSEILVWLALNGPATRDEIVRGLWGEQAERKHVEYFKVAARKLRTALSEHPYVMFDPLPFEHGVYQLSERFEVIVDAAALLSGSSDSPDAWTLLETNQGTFLPGVNSDWAEEMRQQMLETLVTKALQLGSSLELQDPQDAIQLYKRLMTVDPICEGAYLGLERTFRQIGMEAEANIAVSKWRMQFDNSSTNRSRATAPRAS